MKSGAGGTRTPANPFPARTGVSAQPSNSGACEPSARWRHPARSRSVLTRSLATGLQGVRPGTPSRPPTGHRSVLSLPLCTGLGLSGHRRYWRADSVPYGFRARRRPPGNRRDQTCRHDSVSACRPGEVPRLARLPIPDLRAQCAAVRSAVRRWWPCTRISAGKSSAWRHSQLGEGGKSGRLVGYGRSCPAESIAWRSGAHGR